MTVLLPTSYSQLYPLKPKKELRDTAVRSGEVEKNKISAIVAVKKMSDSAGNNRYIIFDTPTTSVENIMNALNQFLSGIKMQ